MKLDLLYEIDVPKPWPNKPHPYGQKEAEQKAYREAFEQIKLADKFGFNTIWSVEHHFREGRSHSPSSEVVLGALSQITREPAPRLRRNSLSARIHPSRPRRREGCDGRRPFRGPSRVGHRPLDADGADGFRREHRNI